MNFYDDELQYLYYSLDEHFDNEKDWLESLSPEILDAYNEYTTDKDNKENY